MRTLQSLAAKHTPTLLSRDRKESLEQSKDESHRKAYEL
jgi:hypothetical protein